MLRLSAVLVFAHGRNMQHLRVLSRPSFTPSANQVENKLTIDSFIQYAVDVQKIRKLKGWVLFQNPAYADNIAALLQDLGANREVVARVLEQFPEAVLCSPDEVKAHMDLWMTICSNQKELLNIITRFPASFFTISHHMHQKANIQYFQDMNIKKRIIRKLMATAPQSFCNPVEKNHEMISTLNETYLSLGGSENNMKIWLQKLINQNPFILLKPPGLVRDNVKFLQDRGFSSAEILLLLSKLKGLITEVNSNSMQAALKYSQEVLQCSQNELKEIVLKCPCIIYYSASTLAERFDGLFKAGIGLGQIKTTPTILELSTEIVLYRIQKLQSCSYDIKTGSLEDVNGTKKDFELTYSRLLRRQERPVFNPVAPLNLPS